MNIFQSWNFRSKSESWIGLSNYTAKGDLKNATGVDTSEFAKKVYLTNLTSNVDKFDIDKSKKCTK